MAEAEKNLAEVMASEAKVDTAQIDYDPGMTGESNFSPTSGLIRKRSPREGLKGGRNIISSSKPV